jgi:hypothetical protein
MVQERSRGKEKEVERDTRVLRTGDVKWINYQTGFVLQIPHPNPGLSFPTKG